MYISFIAETVSSSASADPEKVFAIFGGKE
jgi:hypothetical protein